MNKKKLRKNKKKRKKKKRKKNMNELNIHQIWIQGIESLKVVNPVYYEYSLLWKKYHPHANYKLWSEEEFLPLIEAYNPNLLNVYKKAPNFASKADIARLVILYSIGGLYVDTDIECFKSCEFLLHGDNIDLVIVGMNLSKNKLLFGNFKFNNAWMYARQHCSYLELLLNRIAANPYDSNKWSAYNYTWEITGPKGLTDIVEQYKLPSEPNVRVIPHSIVEGTDFSNLELAKKTKEELLITHPFLISNHHLESSWVSGINGIKQSFGLFYNWLTDWNELVNIFLVIIPIIVLIIILIAWRTHVRRHHHLKTGSSIA